MFDTLFTEYLDAVFPSDYVGHINSCREALVNYNYSGCEANLYKAMPDIAELDTFKAKTMFEQCLLDGFKEVFMLIGFRTNTRKLADLDKLLRAFKNLEDSEAHEDILAVLHSDEYGKLETLEKLLELFSLDQNIADMIFEIEFIKDSYFFTLLHDIHLQASTSVSGEATDERMNDAYKKSVLRFMTKYPEAIVSRGYVDKNILFGEEFSHYIDENADALRLLYPNHPELAPIEFAGMAAFGNVPDHLLAGAIKTAISKFYGDLRFSTKTAYLTDKFMEGMMYESE